MHDIISHTAIGLIIHYILLLLYIYFATQQPTEEGHRKDNKCTNITLSSNDKHTVIS